LDVNDSRGKTRLENVHNLLDAADGASASDDPDHHQHRGPVKIQFVKVDDDESVWFCLPAFGNNTETVSFFFERALSLRNLMHMCFMLYYSFDSR
jgi:hypothetical protein